MRFTLLIILTLFFPFYLSIILLTDISLAGYWTDAILSVVLSILSVRFVVRYWADRRWLTIGAKAINGICALVVILIFCQKLVNPFSWDLKLRSFCYQSVDGRLFNAYFRPVGAYAGGYGNFWITESPAGFPLIEWPVYYERTVHHDFNDDMFDGALIDNYEVVRNYIKEEVIDKQP